MSVIRDGLQYLASIIEKSIKKDFDANSAEAPHVYFRRDVNGVLERCVAEPHPRRHVASTLDGLISAAKNLKGERSRIYVGDGKIVFVVDDENRRDRVTLPLRQSAVFKALQGGIKRIIQKELIWLCRTTLHQALKTYHSDLLVQVRSIKSRGTRGLDSTVGQGTSTLGIDRTETMLGADREFPETLRLEVPFYETPGCTQTFDVWCELDVDAENGVFSIVPRPGELELCLWHIQDDILKALEAGVAGCPIARAALSPDAALGTGETDDEDDE